MKIAHKNCASFLFVVEYIIKYGEQERGNFMETEERTKRKNLITYPWEP